MMVAIAWLFILLRAFISKVKVPAFGTTALTTTAGVTAFNVFLSQVLKIGTVILLGTAALLVYFLFFRTNTVDDYLNNYQKRIEKIQECGHVPDITKDRECMNAITAQRMFMLR